MDRLILAGDLGLISNNNYILGELGFIKVIAAVLADALSNINEITLLPRSQSAKIFRTLSAITSVVFLTYKGLKSIMRLCRTHSSSIKYAATLI